MMKFFRVLFLLSVLIAPSYAQVSPPPFVRDRIEQIARLFEAEPKLKFDTLFTSSFLNAIPEEQMTGIFVRYYKTYGEVVKWHITDSIHPTTASVRLVMSKGYTVDLHVSVSDSTGHLVAGFQIGLGTPQVKSLDALVEKFRKLPGKAGLLIAKMNSDKIEPLASYNIDTPLALGSAFKLYVLGTLEDEIAKGKRHWEDVVILDSASRSLPSGMMHKWPVGTPVTLQTAANMMISLSDNTATDLLIKTLGAENIERLSKEDDSHNNRNVPFLTTVEMFKLKSHNALLGNEYLKKEIDAKRSFLKSAVANVSRDSIDFGGGDPLLIDKIEWFATPREIANQFRWIKNTADANTSAHRVMDVLAINPGLNLDKKKWRYIGYKGGSEPGVLNMSFLLEKNDGTWYVLTASWNNPAKAVDEEAFGGLLERAAELIP